MTQIEKLRTGKWNNQLATAEEMQAKVVEVKEYVDRYDWGDKVIHPYSFGVKIDEFLGWFTDYAKCTHSSKQLHLSEMNGFIEIINKWIKLEEEPKIKIRLLQGNKAGTIKEVAESIASDYIEIGFAEAV